MNQTPASNETKLGILNHAELNKAMQEADHHDFERLEIFIAQELNKSLNQF